MLNFKPFLLATSLFLSLSAVLAQGSGGGRIRYVATDGSASAAGTSWATAVTLQSALDTYIPRDTLFVKKGSYTPTKTRGDGMPTTDPREATYLLPDRITIYGGFAGTETNLADRDMNLIATTNESIIEGNRGDRGSNTDNIWRLFILPANHAATLNGLTLARSYPYVWGRGGGLHARRGSQSTLQHCRFIDHVATLRGSQGGAIYTEGTLRVMNSTFEGNSVPTGEGDSTPFGEGGAIYANSEMVSIMNSSFERNSALEGGAVYVEGGGITTVTGSTFVRSLGGALFVRGAVNIMNSTFEQNLSGRFGSSGAVDVRGKLTVKNSSFRNNSAEESRRVTGTAIYVVSDSAHIVVNSVFKGNSGPHSGAICLYGKNISVMSSTFEGNSAGTGGAISLEPERGRVKAVITNSTFKKNSARFLGIGSAIYVSGTNNNSGGNLTVTNSVFEKNSGTAIHAIGILRVANSIFKENLQAEKYFFGGAISLYGERTEVVGCLFVGNSAYAASVLFSSATKGMFINNTLYGNRDRYSSSGAISLGERFESEDAALTWVMANNIIYGNHGRYDLYLSYGSLIMSNNLIDRNRMESAEGTFISMRNPITPPDDASLLFASLDTEATNYLRLLPGSAGVNAGSNNYIDGNADAFEIADTMGVRDLAGSKRIVNNEVDLGAYEFLGIEVATTPASLTYLPSSEGNITATITLSGFATRWVARAGEGAVGVLTLPSVLTGVSGDRFSFNYAQNTTPEDREAKVVLEAQGAWENLRHIR